MTTSLREQLIGECVREAGMCALVVSIKPGTEPRISCRPNAGLSRHSGAMRRSLGVTHWRIWFADRAQAREVARLLQTRMGLGGPEKTKRACIAIAERQGLRWWSDQRVRLQASLTVNRALLLAKSEAGVKNDSEKGKRQAILTLRGLVIPFFCKPLKMR